MNQGWIGFDLDGTLALYTTWQGISHIGEPIIPMVNKVKELLKSGQRIKIFTARVCSMQSPIDKQKAIDAIETWCEKHIGQRLEITSEKDWGMIEFYDDRCIQIEYNTGVILVGDH